MGNVLTFCETSGTTLRTSALSAVRAARDAAGHHGGDNILVLIGKGVSAAAADARRYGKKVIVVDDPGLEHYMAETYAPVLARLIGEHGATALFATATATGKDLIPRVAGILDAGVASDIAAVVAKDKFRRPVLAGAAYVTVEIAGQLACVTVRQSEVDAATPLDAPGEQINAPAGQLNTCGAAFVRLEATASDRPDLNEADVVVAGGRGMKNGENFKHLEAICDVLGAALGATRAATDAGFVPADLQVGQTGKVVAPKLYIAVGISGAIQHLAGMKNSNVIVAINKDEEAPIFQVADYGMVAKWEDTLPALLEELKKAKAAH